MTTSCSSRLSQGMSPGPLAVDLTSTARGVSPQRALCSVAIATFCSPGPFAHVCVQGSGLIPEEGGD